MFAGSSCFAEQSNEPRPAGRGFRPRRAGVGAHPNVPIEMRDAVEAAIAVQGNEGADWGQAPPLLSPFTEVLRELVQSVVRGLGHPDRGAGHRGLQAARVEYLDWHRSAG